MENLELIDISKEKQELEIEPTIKDNVAIPDGMELIDISKEEFDTDPKDFALYKDDAVVASLRESGNTDKALELSDGDVAWSFETTQGVSPSEARDIKEVSDYMKMPSNVVREELKKSKSIAKYTKAIERIGTRKEDNSYKYPKTVKWMIDPDNASFGKNDVDRLTEIEDIKRAKENEDNGFFTNTAYALAQGSANMGVTLAEMPALAYQVIVSPVNFASKMLDDDSIKIETPKWLKDNVIAEYYSEQARLFTPKQTKESAYDQIFEKGEYTSGAYNVFLQAVSNAPVLATMAMGGIAGLSSKAILGGMGAFETSSSLYEGAKEGKHPWDNLGSSVMKGIAEGFFEKYTLGTMTTILKRTGKELIETVGKETARSIILKNSYEIVKGAGIEGSSEFLTSVAQDVSDYTMGDSEALTDAGKRAVNAFMVGMLPGAAMQTVGAARNSALKSKYLSDQQEQMSKISNILEKTELKEASPDAAESFVETIVGQESVYVELEDIEEFYQSKRDNKEANTVEVESEIAKIAEELGIDSQIEDAKTSGGKIEISKSKWIAKIAETEIGRHLNPKLSFSVDGITAEDSRRITSEVSSQISEMQISLRDKDQESEIEQIKEMREILIAPVAEGGQGQSANDADIALSLLLAGARTMGKGSAKEFLTKYKLRLKSGGTFGESGGTTISSNKPYEDIIKKVKAKVMKNPDTLTGEAKIYLDESVDAEIELIIQEIKASRKGGREYLPGEHGTAKPNVIKVKGTFPDYYADFKVINQAHLREITLKKKGKPYLRVRAEAIRRLVEGYGNEHSGAVRANEEIRSLLGLDSVEGVADKDFTLFQKDKSGFTIRKDEKIHESIGNIKEVYKPVLKQMENAVNLGKEKSANDAIIKVAEMFKNKTFTNNNTSSELKFNDVIIGKVVKNAYEKRLAVFNEGQSGRSKRPLANLTFSNTVNALANMSKVVASAIPVTRQLETNNEVYFSVMTIGKNDAAVKLVVDKNNNIVDMVSVIVKSPPSSQKIAQKDGTSTEQGGNISIAEFQRIFNEGRNNKEYFQSKNKGNQQVSDKNKSAQNEQESNINSKDATNYLQGDETVKGSIAFSDANTIISLFKTADKSTLLHEVGHLFLRELEIAAEIDGVKSKDLAVLREFAGGKLDVDGVERIVEGFEAYLREGNAPTIELQSAFHTFKKWLTAIYKNLKDLPTINDEVRSVFSRMLATEQEIEQAEQFYKDKESLASILNEDAITVKKMDELKGKVKQTAEEKLLSKYMKSYLSEVGGKSTLKKDLKKEVTTWPVFKSLDALMIKGITEAESIEYMGEELTEKLKETHKGLIRKGGDSNISEISIDNNYNSGYQMLKELANTDTKDNEVLKELDKFIEKKEQEIAKDLMDNGTLKGEAELHNEKSIAFLIAENKLLENKLSQSERKSIKAYSTKLYRDVAKEMIMKLTTKRAGRYDLFSKTEQKFANKSYRLAKEGKFLEAAKAKKKQILNHILVQESIKIRDFKRKAEKKYKTRKLAKRLEKVEFEYVQIASKIINSHGLNPDISPTQANVKKILTIDEGLAAQIPLWVEEGLAPSGKLNFKEMTIAEFIELDESIDAIIHSGRGTLLSMQNEELATIQEVVDESIYNMSKIKDKSIDPEFTKKKGIYGYIDQAMIGAKRFVNNTIADTVMIEYLFEELDNFKMHKYQEFGVLRKLFNRGRKAEGDHNAMVSDTIKDASSSFDNLSKAVERIELQYGKSFTLKGFPVPEVLKEAGKDQWTVEKLISFLLNTGNTHNLEVLTNAYQLTGDNLNVVSSLFTTSELESIQDIWDVTNKLYQPLNDTNFRIYNRNLAKVEAAPITLISNNGDTVTLPGGYYPLSFDRSISDIAEKQQEDDLMKDRNSAVLRSSKPSDGMTKTRSGVAHSLPPLLSLSVWTRHVSDTSRYITHAEYLRDMNRITTNVEWTKNVRKKAGKKLYANIRDWLKYQARPERRIIGSWEKILDKQKGMATSLILGLNMSVALKQRLSGFSAQVDLGGTWILKALVDSDVKGSVLGLSTSKMWTEIMGKSKYIRARNGAMDREINDTVSNISPFIKRFNIPGLDKKLTYKDAKDAVFFLIQANDRAMTGVVWKAAYMKSLDATKNILSSSDAEVKAIEFADSIVAQTQPSSLPIDLNELQKSEGAMRLFTAFMTWTFKQGNRFNNKYNAWQSGAITNKEYMSHVIQEGLFAPWGAAIIGSLMLSGELPEWWEYFTSPMEYGISWIPLVRDVPGVVKYRRGIGEIPAFEGANRFVKTGETAYDWANGDKEFGDFLYSVGQSAEAVTGIPLLKVVKNMNNTRKILNGEKRKKR